MMTYLHDFSRARLSLHTVWCPHVPPNTTSALTSSGQHVPHLQRQPYTTDINEIASEYAPDIAHRVEDDYRFCSKPSRLTSEIMRRWASGLGFDSARSRSAAQMQALWRFQMLWANCARNLREKNYNISVE